MTKHTQWEVVEGTHTKYGIMCGESQVCDDICNNSISDKATAQLIASAPALLEACKIALEMFDLNDGDSIDLIKTLQQAINQAEG